MAKKTLKRNEDGEKLRMYLIGLPLKDSSKMVAKLAEAVKYHYIPFIIGAPDYVVFPNLPRIRSRK